MQIKQQRVPALRIEADRMEPLDETVYSKYLQLFVVVPTEYSPHIQPTDMPKWYQYEYNKPPKLVNPKIEKVLEKNGKYYFKYFLYKTPNKDIGVSHLSRKNKNDWTSYFVELQTSSGVILFSSPFYLISKPPEYYKRSHVAIEEENNEIKTTQNTTEEPQKKKTKVQPKEEFNFSNLTTGDQLFLNSFFSDQNYQNDLQDILKKINFEPNNIFTNPFSEERYDLFTPKTGTPKSEDEIGQYFICEEEQDFSKRNSKMFIEEDQFKDMNNDFNSDSIIDFGSGDIPLLDTESILASISPCMAEETPQPQSNSYDASMNGTRNDDSLERSNEFQKLDSKNKMTQVMLDDEKDKSQLSQESKQEKNNTSKFKSPANSGYFSIGFGIFGRSKSSQTRNKELYSVEEKQKQKSPENSRALQSSDDLMITKTQTNVKKMLDVSKEKKKLKKNIRSSPQTSQSQLGGTQRSSNIVSSFVEKQNEQENECFYDNDEKEEEESDEESDEELTKRIEIFQIL
eukprot:gene226-4472_t